MPHLSILISTFVLLDEQDGLIDQIIKHIMNNSDGQIETVTRHCEMVLDKTLLDQFTEADKRQYPTPINDQIYKKAP